MAYQNLPGIQFGAGIILATPQAGDLAPNPTPIEIGIIQNLSFDISGDIKELFGQKQWSIDSAVGKRSIKGTFEYAQMTNELLSQMFFADAVTPGIVQNAYREQHTIPATPYQITVTPPTGTFAFDEGVVNLTTGAPLTKLPTGTPAAGQYTVTTGGQYTFAAADTTLRIAITYAYTNVALGTTLAVNNHPMGWGPVLSLMLMLPYENNIMSLYLPQCRFGKISAKTKLDDYMMLTSDFAAFAGAADNPMTSYNLF